MNDHPAYNGGDLMIDYPAYNGGNLMIDCPAYKDGNLVIVCVPKVQTGDVEYYSNVLCRLKDDMKEKRRGKLRKGVPFVPKSMQQLLRTLTRR